MARAKAKSTDRMDTGTYIPNTALDANTDEEEDEEDLALASRVLGATLAHATQTGSLSAVKQIATEFVGGLYLVSSSLPLLG